MYTVNIVIILLFFLPYFLNIYIRNMIYNKINTLLSIKLIKNVSFYRIILFTNSLNILYLYLSSFFSQNNTTNYEYIYLSTCSVIIIIHIREITQLRDQLYKINIPIKKEIGIQVSLKEIAFNKKNGIIQSESTERLQKILNLKKKKTG
jgi:hypothetical protein